MNKLICFFLLIFQFGLVAQDFAPVGAIWHYTQYDPLKYDMITFKTIESLSDTTVNGKQCKKMVEVIRFYADTFFIRQHYMYRENDSVFFYAENEFHLLYDFGAIPGDSVILDYFPTYDGSPLVMVVDSLSTININGEERVLQYITCGDGILIEFGSPVIEGIGSAYYMFPTYDGTYDGPLRCYQDTLIGLFLSPFHSNYGWNHEDCDYIITSTSEYEYSNELFIYPNPIGDKFLVRNLISESNFIISDITGRILQSGIIKPGFEIPVQDLSGGIYILILAQYKSINKERKYSTLRFIVSY